MGQKRESMTTAILCVLLGVTLAMIVVTWSRRPGNTITASTPVQTLRVYVHKVTFTPLHRDEKVCGARPCVYEDNVPGYFEVTGFHIFGDNRVPVRFSVPAWHGTECLKEKTEVQLRPGMLPQLLMETVFCEAAP